MNQGICYYDSTVCDGIFKSCCFSNGAGRQGGFSHVSQSLFLIVMDVLILSLGATCSIPTPIEKSHPSVRDLYYLYLVTCLYTKAPVWGSRDSACVEQWFYHDYYPILSHGGILEG